MLSIIGHIFVILSNKRVIQETILIVLDVFAIGVIGSLIYIFPFDFSVIPNPAIADMLPWQVTLSLSLVMLAFVIAVIVRLVKLVTALVKGAIVNPIK